MMTTKVIWLLAIGLLASVSLELVEAAAKNSTATDITKAKPDAKELPKVVATTASPSIAKKPAVQAESKLESKKLEVEPKKSTALKDIPKKLTNKANSGNPVAAAAGALTPPADLTAAAGYHEKKYMLVKKKPKHKKIKMEVYKPKMKYKKIKMKVPVKKMKKKKVKGYLVKKEKHY